MKGKLEVKVKVFAKVPESPEVLPSLASIRDPRSQWMKTHVMFYFAPIDKENRILGQGSVTIRREDVERLGLDISDILTFKLSSE
jgi:hypothetical protein